MLRGIFPEDTVRTVFAPRSIRLFEKIWQEDKGADNCRTDGRNQHSRSRYIFRFACQRVVFGRSQIGQEFQRRIHGFHSQNHSDTERNTDPFQSADMTPQTQQNGCDRSQYVDTRIGLAAKQFGQALKGVSETEQAFLYKAHDYELFTSRKNQEATLETNRFPLEFVKILVLWEEGRLAWASDRRGLHF